jgi:hypothetical protein
MSYLITFARDMLVVVNPSKARVLLAVRQEAPQALVLF